MANKISNTDNILELGEKNVIEEEKKKRKKKLVFPILLVFFGVLLMGCGLFFNEVTSFLGININKGTAKEKKVKEINEVITCNYEQIDDSLGFITEIENKYVLAEKKLISMEQKRVITADPNKEISANNLKIINGKYDDLIKTIDNSNGVTMEDSLKENVLTVMITVDFKNFDIKNFPANDLIVITNYYNQDRKSVKEVEAKAGHLCK